MSRFDHIIYLHTLKYPHRRCRTSKLRKVKPLWKEIKPYSLNLYQIAFNFLSILTIAIAMLGLVLYFINLNYFDIRFYVITTFSLAAIVTLLSMIRYHYRNKMRNNNTNKRSPVNFPDFYARICESNECPEGFVKAIRDTIGFMYCVSPEMIYVDDTPFSLQSIGGVCAPYGYELILGIEKKLKIKLPDTKIDSLIENIYNNASNVEDIIKILCYELSGFTKS